MNGYLRTADHLMEDGELSFQSVQNMLFDLLRLANHSDAYKSRELRSEYQLSPEIHTGLIVSGAVVGAFILSLLYCILKDVCISEGGIYENLLAVAVVEDRLPMVQPVTDSVGATASYNDAVILAAAVPVPAAITSNTPVATAVRYV
jgi:hypothetical protein